MQRLQSFCGMIRLAAPFLGRGAVVAGLLVALIVPVDAQFFPFFNSQRRVFPQFQFRGPLGPSVTPQPEQRADYSRAPAARKSEVAPTTKVVVMGDSLADWLAYGLEDAFADTPEIGVVRKHRTYSGLLRYESRSDTTWAQVARDVIAAEKPDIVVMMLGVNDRQSIRERAPATQRRGSQGAETQAAEQPAQDQPGEQRAADQAGSQNDEGGDLQVTPEPPSRGASAALEYRTDRWAAAYGKRIGDTITALKSVGVPVIWVGLPALRGTRSTSDMLYLNGLYRAAAERANIVFVDVWDGFVDDDGKFTVQGPDLEGQMRRLRTADGVHFTKAGARKLAHYIEREVHRLMGNRATPVALPAPDVTPQPQGLPPGMPAPRPIAGPVLPLTLVSGGSDELLGGGTPRALNTDPIAVSVLTRGEALTPPPGRADDFTWPRLTDGSENAFVPTIASAPAAPDLSATPVVARENEGAAPARPAASSKAAPPTQPPPERASPRRTEPSVAQRPPAAVDPRPAPRSEPRIIGFGVPRPPAGIDERAPRPPAPVGPSTGWPGFGSLFR